MNVRSINIKAEINVFYLTFVDKINATTPNGILYDFYELEVGNS